MPAHWVLIIECTNLILLTKKWWLFYTIWRTISWNALNEYIFNFCFIKMPHNTATAYKCLRVWCAVSGDLILSSTVAKIKTKKNIGIICFAAISQIYQNKLSIQRKIEHNRTLCICYTNTVSLIKIKLVVTACT